MSLLIKVKEESEKICLKFNIQKTKIMASSPISSVQFSCSVVSNSLQPHEPHFLSNTWGSNGNHDGFFFSWAPNWLQMMTAVMELKDTCSFEEKLWAT